MLLLASATPCVESYYKAEKGDYALIKLTERFGNAVLPDTMIADMRYNGYGSSEILSKHLIAELSARKERGEKSVLFLNRRGFHVFMSCRDCGEAVMCPNCSVSLTLHKKHYRNGDVSERLMCHYCGYTVTPPKKCPSCQKENLKYFGLGTQKIEEELENALPETSYIRMDADTTVGKMAHKKIIDTFTDKKDVLIGTQMVTKGHDFRDVTLVGILSADMSLHSDDYRANERTFSLITQCAGRAGRANNWC
jgi:primosomal protein N' (replication factor Y)